jgi:hypothetical protein
MVIANWNQLICDLCFLYIDIAGHSVLVNPKNKKSGDKLISPLGFIKARYERPDQNYG